MVTNLADDTEKKSRKRRSSHHKGSKQVEEQRRRIKNVLFWVLIMAVGVAAVSAIAVLAGQGAS